MPLILPPLSCRLIALAVMTVMPFGAVATETLGPVMEEGFREDFDSDRLDNRLWYISDGWTNGDHQDCYWSRSAVRVEDGMLRLAHIPSETDEPPLCGEIQTNSFIHFGTIEARIRTPRASGLNASVFTYAGPVHGVPHDEIDIEILTRNPGEVALNTYVSGEPESGTTVPIAPPLDTTFHDVAMQWHPDRIIWFINGEEVHRTTPDAPLPVDPQKIYMSFWSTTMLTDWMGVQGPRSGTLEYEVDWLAYTPLDESCLFEGSVTC